MEELFILLTLLLISIVIYILYTSFWIQVLFRKAKYRTLILKKIAKDTNATYYDTAYFATSHKLITKKEYASFSGRHKFAFTKCYNALRFKTADAQWELFFYLVKEGITFSEIITIRVFPFKNKIKSEGNIEKTFSRLNIVTNNRYLSELLEKEENKVYLNWLLKKSGEILLVTHNNLHFKAFVDSEKLTSKRIHEMVRVINTLQKRIYKEGVLEY